MLANTAIDYGEVSHNSLTRTYKDEQSSWSCHLNNLCVHARARERIGEGWGRERDLELKDKSFDVVAIKKKYRTHLGKGIFF
jgi:hypothetical protein